jgi:hypothetical protein
LKKSASFFHIPFNGMEWGLLGSRWNGGRRSSGGQWRSRREYKKVDEKEKPNEKRP